MAGGWTVDGGRWTSQVAKYFKNQESNITNHLSTALAVPASLAFVAALEVPTPRQDLAFAHFCRSIRLDPLGSYLQN